MQFWPYFILIVIYGACVGSFLNVVIYRLPEGRSLLHPPSQCPRCGNRLRWYDNLPVIGWIKLRGKCRFCQAPISIQYPAIEALTAILFAAVTLVYYHTDAQPGFADAGLFETWPVLLVHLTLVASLVAATMIDARLYIIPLGIPWTATLIAAIGLPVATAWSDTALNTTFPVGEAGLGVAAGGLVGLGLAVLLLQLRVLPLSFDDDPEASEAVHQEKIAAQQEKDSPANPEDWPVHPHPRREMLKECLFLAFPVIGAIIGWLLLRPASETQQAMDMVLLPDMQPTPEWMVPAVQVFAGAALGYLVGGALIWFTRVAGTFAFNKEAMGLGDVHLLAAIGAVVGPLDVVYVFFAAPFIGLTATIVAGLSDVLKGRMRVIPYGPYLAIGAVVVMLLGRTIYDFVDLRVLLP